MTDHEKNGVGAVELDLELNLLVKDVFCTPGALRSSCIRMVKEESGLGAANLH